MFPYAAERRPNRSPYRCVSYSDPYGLCANCGAERSLVDKVKDAGLYTSRDKAAVGGMQSIWKRSVDENREYGGEIVNLGGLWRIEGPRKGDISAIPLYPGLPGYDGYFHSHGAYKKGYANEAFSRDDPNTQELDRDKGIADRTGKPGYLVTPSGVMKRYDPDPNKKGQGKITVVGHVR